MGRPTPFLDVSELPLYVGGKSSVAGMAQVVKLSSNESALGPSPKAMEAYGQAGSSLHRYPDGSSPDLRAAIADTYALPEPQIICGSGSDEILCLVCRAFAGPGTEVIHTQHGFLMYGIYAQSVGATPVVVPETDLTADVDAILEAVTEQTRIVFLANPNNPTGTIVSAEELMRLRAELRDDVVLVIDGAYAEYMDGVAGYESGLGLASATPNTIATRTFSKLYGLGGLRLGWGFGDQDLIDVLNRLRSPFNITTPAQAAGVAAVQDTQWRQKVREHTVQWRDVAIQRLRGMGLSVPASFANFVLPEFPDQSGRTAADADAFLQSKGLIARRVESYGLPNHLRITIGTEEEMHALFAALEEFMGATS